MNCIHSVVNGAITWQGLVILIQELQGVKVVYSCSVESSNLKHPLLKGAEDLSKTLGSGRSSQIHKILFQGYVSSDSCQTRKTWSPASCLWAMLGTPGCSSPGLSLLWRIWMTFLPSSPVSNTHKVRFPGLGAGSLYFVLSPVSYLGWTDICLSPQKSHRNQCPSPLSGRDASETALKFTGRTQPIHRWEVLRKIQITVSAVQTPCHQPPLPWFG